MLALALWQTSGSAFAGCDAVSAEDTTDVGAAVFLDHPDEACFTAPQLPYLPVAELASANGHIQPLALSRIQRHYITEYLFSLKDRVNALARREAVLSLHREKLFEVAARHRFQPVCAYYIFALRRILI